MQRLIEIISAQNGKADITESSRLIEDKLLGSLDMVMLVGELNESYAVSISADDITPENFRTPKDIASLIERLGGEVKWD